MTNTARHRSPHDRLLDSALPSLLRSIGCDDAAEGLVELAEAEPDGVGADERLSALEEASDAALEAAAHHHVSPSLAARSEAVASLARHLLRHEELQFAAPRSAAHHLARAVELGLELGERLGVFMPRGVAEGPWAWSTRSTRKSPQP